MKTLPRAQKEAMQSKQGRAGQEAKQTNVGDTVKTPDQKGRGSMHAHGALSSTQVLCCHFLSRTLMFRCITPISSWMKASASNSCRM